MPRFAGYVLGLWCVYFVPWGMLGAAEHDIGATPPPTAREAKILAELSNKTEADFAEQPLADVIEYFKQRHDIEIQLDAKALVDAGVGIDTPVTRALKGIALRSMLRLMLGELDLTYHVGDGYLLVTSKTEAERMLRSQVYPVADLVTTDSEFRPMLPAGAKPVVDFKNLIDVLTLCVAPTTWHSAGGPGSVEGHRNSRTLSISQTDEAQEDVAQFLAALRRVRDAQLTVAKPVDPFAKRQPAREQPKGELDLRVHRLAAATQGKSPAKLSKPAVPAKQSPKNADTQAEKKDAAPAEANAAPPKTPGRNLETIAHELAEAVPEIIEPESWGPAGGRIRAVGDTLLVWHNDEVQARVSQLIREILPGGDSLSDVAYYPAVRLPPPVLHAVWPHEEGLTQNAKEIFIRQKLEEPTALDFAEQPLADVIEFLKQKHDIEIQLDNKALTDAGVGNDTPITRTLSGLTLKTVLKLILDELDLTYVVRNEVLVVTSKTEAESMLVVKIYPVFDLVVRPLDASPRLPGMDFTALAKSIMGQVAPTTWHAVGGPGEIKEFVNSGALVISQTTAAHEEIAAYLRALRQAARTQE